MTTEATSIPLFPLDVVLFPGMVLPLHIFEPRYREMVSRCLRSDAPQGPSFGVSLMLGATDGREQPAEIGTRTQITGVQRLDGGRYNLSTVGVDRFRIRSLSHNEPYLVGSVEPFPALDGQTAEARRLAGLLRGRLQSYIKGLGSVMEREVNIGAFPASPESLAFLAAILLQVPNPEKQTLLAIASIPDLLRAELDLFDHENLIVRIHADWRDRMPAMIDAPIGTFSTS